MIHDLSAALTDLRPNADWTLRGDTYADLEWNDSKQTKPTESEVNAKCAELKTAYDNKKYQRDREAEYPSVVDQLDDIYHNGIDAWKATIKVTKDKYPKS